MKQKTLNLCLIIGAIFSVISCIFCAIDTAKHWQMLMFYISIENSANVISNEIQKTIFTTIPAFLSLLCLLIFILLFIKLNKLKKQ